MAVTPDKGAPSSVDLLEALRARLADEGIGASAVERAGLIVNLTRFFSRLGQDSESVHRKLGWSWAGFRVMNLLWAAGPMESRDLARMSGSSRATISSLLSTLERDGLVGRKRSETDRRQVLVALTAEGEARLQRGLIAQAQVDEAWFRVLDDDQRHEFGDLLRALAEQRSPSVRAATPVHSTIDSRK